MRRIPVASAALGAVALVAAACGGGGPAATALPTVPPVNIPSGAVPSVTIPSVAIPSISIPSGIDIPSLPPLGGSFAIPSFVLPSFNANADPELAAKFPTTVDGNPVTRVETVNFVEFFQAFGGLGSPDQAAKFQAFVQLLANNGIDATKLAFGNASATVNGSPVQIQAFRTPGVPATTFVSLYPQLAQIDQTQEQLPTQGNANIGGKNVITFTDSTGNVTYIYPAGDIAWSVATSDPAEATAVFSALQ